MDAIAEKSGVSKATIYRSIGLFGKDALLLLEMMAELNGMRARPVFHSRAADTNFLTWFRCCRDRPLGNLDFPQRIMPHFVGYLARNRAFGVAWKSLVMEPPRRELKQLMRQGIAEEESAPNLDLDLSLALLLGPKSRYWHVFLRDTSDIHKPWQRGSLGRCGERLD